MNAEIGKNNAHAGKEEIHITCYGKEETWTSRQEAMNFYKKCMCASEGSERERYAIIYTQLLIGSNNCSDE